MEQQNSKRKKVMKQCGVCEQDIQRTSFAKHLKTDCHLLKTVMTKKSESWKFIVEANELENHFVSDRHVMSRTKGVKQENYL